MSAREVVNEPFGASEQLPLNERSGDFGQLATGEAASAADDMTAKEQRALDGTITGDMRDGPVRIRIKRAVLSLRADAGAEPLP